MRILACVLIVIALLAVGCRRHHGHSINNPDVSVDPWIPPYDGHPGPSDSHDQQPVPEPSTFVLMGSGLAALYLRHRRSKKT